jgi:hypothetical protein
MNRCLPFFIYMTLIIGTTVASHANSTGIPGRTNRTVVQAAGCGTGCHGSSPNEATSIVWSGITDHRITMNAGETRRIDVVVSNANRIATGINIAFKSQLEAPSSIDKVLQPLAGGGVGLSFRELVHNEGPRMLNGGSATFSFTITAPLAGGTYYLQAVANAVNRNGQSDGNDQWNWATPVEVVVDGTVSVQAEENRGVAVWPLPAHDIVNITAPAEDGEEFRLEILDLNGRSLQQGQVVAQAGTVAVAWDGRNHQGEPVSPGTYLVALTSQHRVYRRRVQISY